MRLSTPFNDVPGTPRGHLALLVYEAAYQLVHMLRERAAAAGKDLDAVFEEFPFLLPYFTEIGNRMPENIEWRESLEWLRGRIIGWESNHTEWLPLRSLAEELRLPAPSIRAFILAGVVEEASSFSHLFSSLQSGGERRPTLDLLSSVIQPGAHEDAADAWDLCRPLFDAGLVEAVNLDDPRSQWQLRVPAAIWNAVRGDCGVQPAPGLHYHPASEFGDAAQLILPDAMRRRIEELGRLMGTGRARTIVIRGLPGADRLETAGSLSRGLGRGLMAVDCAGGPHEKRYGLLGPLATLTKVMPAFLLDLAPGETFEVPTLAGYRGPVAVILGMEGGITGEGAEQSVSLQLEPETEPLRLLSWSRALDGAGAENLPEIAANFTLPARYIRQSAQLAATYAALEQRSQVTAADVRLATRAINRQTMDALATRLEPVNDWSRVVVRSSTREDLANLARRCRHREHLATSLGDHMPGGLNRGVRALFEGPSGTGKTLAARILAGVLKLDIYRADLASIVNRYIGETEKNLSRVLSRAEDLNVVLLLDEGDALMTRRTDVKSANDRYANLETNYLLQRLDTFAGILVVTTNAGSYIDSGFRRRMDVVVNFYPPDAEQRWRLWQLHLPASHVVDPETLEEYSVRYALTGGQIRNAAIHASLLAADNGQRRVGPEDLREAIQAEYRKAGASFPVEASIAQNRNEGCLTSFLGAIS